MKTHTVFAASLLAASLLYGPAHAGRPLQTEDAGILDPGACEIEGATERLSASGAKARESALQLGCGVGASTQLALAVATARDAGASARGVRLGGKTGLWLGDGDRAAALTLAYAVASTKASGDRWRHSANELNLVYSQPLPDATLHANLGHAHDPQSGERATTWALAYEHAGIGELAPMAELFGDDRGAPWWNLGLRFTALPDKLFFDASYGRQLASGRAALWTLGFKFAL